VPQLAADLGPWDISLTSDRSTAVHAVVDALRSTGPWSGPTGVVRVDIDLADGGRESWSVRFTPTGVALVDADPQVVVRLPLDALIRLATGATDGALLYLAGELEVVGDEELLLGIGSALPAASGRPLIDAAALDPLSVSAAIADVRTEHLASVMAGGFRGLVLAEVFRRLPEFMIAEKAERVRVAVAFEIGGRHDGEVDRYVVRIAEGECVVIPAADADSSVDATLVLEGHQFLRLVLGHLNPVRGVLSGELQVKGQVLKALGFNSVMRIPSSHTPGS
jgi:putative sterol carrier protein